MQSIFHTFPSLPASAQGILSIARMDLSSK
jgi:hypothetical protein